MRLLRPTLMLFLGSSRAFQPAIANRCLSRAATSSLSAFTHFKTLRNMSTESTETDTPVESSNSNSNIVPFTKPERVIHSDLPVVYVYDHCPFCVRVRLALGLKNIKHTALFLANDDVKTPTALIGKKIAPIFEWKEANIVMPESMDIIKLIDSDERFGAPHLIKPSSGRTDLKDWQSSTRDLLRVLQRPRYVATGLLPEFQQLDGRHAFIFKHEMPPYNKESWKELPMKEKLAIYAEAMSKDPADDIEELNRKLVELNDIVTCEHHCSPGGLCLDDIDLFSRLRSITIIRGVEWPSKLRKYMNHLSEIADVPLYDEMAL
ncbi:hypothetical protein MPSEU_000181100 [Mayamaea pseudoterrestris]|nr:hypothetical protein MPSEU_000181100 [Mayamaea pseudoterrestris]